MSANSLMLYELAGADPALRFSPQCWKVRMALAHKNLTADGIPWRFVEKDVIAFTGQGAVPVLLHGEEAIWDSWQIALHLDERFPNTPPLFDGASAIPVTRFVNGWADSVLLPAVARVIILDIYDCLDDRDREYFRVTRERKFGQTLEQIAADRPANLLMLRKILTPLRQMLKGQNFIGGSRPRYADYCVFGMLMWAHCVSATVVLEDEDLIFAWRERLLDAFDGFARSAPSIATRREEHVNGR